MRALMLGWDFSPRLSGGVGSACRGLANALARAPEDLRAEVLFVLPHLRGDEEPEKVRLLVGQDPPPSSRAEPPAPEVPAGSAPRPTARTASAQSSPLRVALEPAAPSQEPTPRVAPTLPAPAEALRLLEIDSPLRPYLSPSDYASLVRGLLERIQRSTPRTPRAPQAPPSAVQPAPHSPVASPVPPPTEPRAAPTRPQASPTPTESPKETPLRVPPYGTTLLEEVERYARATLALVQAESFDVIHAHDWMTFPAGLLLQERTGNPLVVHFHSSEIERRGTAARDDVRRIEQAAIDAADRVICVSEESARVLREQYAFQHAKLRVLHNAFSPLECAAGFTPEEKAPQILFMGRLSEQKGPDVFLEAAAKVRTRHPEATFVLAGEGELYPELRGLAEELDLSDRVRFTGFVSGPELAKTYAAADVYVMSSAAEPFGISALEALSLGVPTIVPARAGVTEVVRSVLRFEPGDAGELADKIVSLLERPALRKQLSASGLEEVERLRWDRPARILRGLYGEIAIAP